MPDLEEVAKEINENSAQDVVRRRYLAQLAAYTTRDTILYASRFLPGELIPGTEVLVGVSTADIKGFMSATHGLSGKELDLIIHSPGGSLEATEQIVNYLRAKYDSIRAIIPLSAMSAATMLACACDSIVMGKQSALGPIDPQITLATDTGQVTVPAQALLDEFARAKKEVKADESTAALWITRVDQYPPGYLNICEDTIELAKLKVGEWLVSYMLKDAKDAKEKAQKIAEWLGSAQEHKTHGRPISAALASKIGLKIERLEDDSELQDLVLSVFHATSVTWQCTGCVKIFENQNGKGFYTTPMVSKK